MTADGDELLLLVDDAVDCGDGGDDACMVARKKRAAALQNRKEVRENEVSVSQSVSSRAVPPRSPHQSLLSRYIRSALSQSVSYVAVPPRRLTTLRLKGRLRYNSNNTSLTSFLVSGRPPCLHRSKSAKRSFSLFGNVPVGKLLVWFDFDSP